MSSQRSPLENPSKYKQIITIFRQSIYVTFRMLRDTSHPLLRIVDIFKCRHGTYVLMELQYNTTGYQFHVPSF